MSETKKKAAKKKAKKKATKKKADATLVKATAKKPPKERYCYALSDDGHFSGSFETRETALSEAIVAYDLEEGASVYTGVIEDVDPTTLTNAVGLHIDGILETVSETAEETVGEVSEDWLMDVGEETAKKMDAELCALVTKWITEYLPFKFHSVNDEQHHVVTKEEASGSD